MSNKPVNVPNFGGIGGGANIGFKAGEVRLNTGLRRIATPGGAPLDQPVGLNTDVKLDYRPVTGAKQGLSGMRTAHHGPGRQIADRSYYTNELRGKLTAITREIKKLREECVQLESDRKEYSSLTVSHEQTKSEVEALRERLAELNMAVDHLSSGTDLDTLRQSAEKLKAVNDQLRSRTDDVFVNAKQNEERVASTTRKIEDMYAAAEQSLEPAALTKFRSLRDLASKLAAEQAEARKKIGELDKSIEFEHEELKSPVFITHQRGVVLRRQRNELVAKKTQVEDELSASQNPDQLREKLAARANTANAEIRFLTQRSETLEGLLEEYGDRVRQKERQLTEARKHASRAKKYEAIFERDHKMQEFIESFEQNMRAEQDKKALLQKTIVALLSHISRGLASQQDLPDKAKFDEVKDDLSFKQMKLKSAEETLEHLKEQKLQRKQDLDKLTSLYGKIQKEISGLKSEMERMKQEMNSFRSIDELKVEAEEEKRTLEKRKVRSTNRQEALAQQVALLTRRFEQSNSKLQSNEILKKIDGLAKRLSSLLSMGFTVEDYILQQKREANFERLRGEVMELYEEINRRNIEAVSKQDI